MRCGLVVGQLIAHSCGRKTDTRCAGCGQPVCEAHQDGGRCLACLGRWAEPQAPVSVSWEEMMGFSDEEAALFASRGRSPGEGLHTYDS